ncbi:UNVERIFIED_CONTAM: hypothetical protein Sradi_5063400 [Sesamum radiatum]|uniref:Uncharacterized protein n=1 Tax=Sesamum radiatum TaxID=300843 RepID=A0AAW2M4L3_SESRA
MVTSWIWNSISKELIEAFMYASTSRELWLELQGRYGRSNGPMIYQIQRELSIVLQGDLSVTAYFTKDESTQLMQFLMGLHEVYDSKRSQVLMMDPLSDVEKAYSMILTVEKQRSVNLGIAYSQVFVCDRCHKIGHLKEVCSKLHSVPDWYKALSEQKKKGTRGRNIAANVENKTGDDGINSQAHNTASQNNITEMMTKILKLVKRQQLPSDPLTTSL